MPNSTGKLVICLRADRRYTSSLTQESGCVHFLQPRFVILDLLPRREFLASGTTGRRCGVAGQPSNLPRATPGDHPTCAPIPVDVHQIFSQKSPLASLWHARKVSVPRYYPIRPGQRTLPRESRPNAVLLNSLRVDKETHYG